MSPRMIASQPHARVLLLAFCALFLSQLAAAPPARTISTSRQFTVFGCDITLRGAISEGAEQTKSKLLRVLQTGDAWSVPMLINLKPRETNLPELPDTALNFRQTDAGLKIQIDLVVDREFDAGTLRREVMRALLLEMGYRSTPSVPAGTHYALSPCWLVEGLLTIENESPELLDALEGMMARPQSLRSVVTQDPALLDSQSRAIYNAYANALVRILVEQENGRAQLLRYINDVPHATTDPLLDLLKDFPRLGSSAEVAQKRWVTALAALAAGQRFALLSFEATGDQLEQCLQEKVAYDRANSLTLEQACATRRARVDTTAAHALAERLMLLSARSHPLLRCVIADYQRAAESLSHKRPRGSQKRLAATATLRGQLTRRMHDVDDFMNWYEATQAKRSSGTFAGYLRTAQTADAVSRRHDPLSVYLDSMEAQFQ